QQSRLLHFAATETTPSGEIHRNRAAAWLSIRCTSQKRRMFSGLTSCGSRRPVHHATAPPRHKVFGHGGWRAPCLGEHWRRTALGEGVELAHTFGFRVGKPYLAALVDRTQQAPSSDPLRRAW